jgi:hypothetical protein
LPPIEPNDSLLLARLKNLGKPCVTLTDIRKLVEIEAAEAQKRGLESFKYGTNEEMLGKIMSIG